MSWNIEDWQHHMTAVNEERCVTCLGKLTDNYVPCHRCLQFRYCSTKCLEEDKLRHKQLCDYTLHVKNLFEGLEAGVNEGDNGDSNSSNRCGSGTHVADNGASNGESFGKGWWNGKKKTESKPGSSVKSSTSDRGETFGKGWWKGERKSQSKPGSSATPQTRTSTSTSSVKSSTSDAGDTFGKGWWKGGTQSGNGKTKTNSSSKKEKDPKTSAYAGLSSENSQRDLSKRSLTVDQCFNIIFRRMDIEMSKQCLNLENETKPNNCTDIVERADKITLEWFIEFEVIKNHIRKSPEILELDGYQGRNVSTVLRDVPSLYKASLGGSRKSVVVRIIGPYKGFKNTVLVQDNSCVQVPVIFDVPLGEHEATLLKADNFVLLRGVFWQTLPDGYLGIKVVGEKSCHFIVKKV